MPVGGNSEKVLNKLMFPLQMCSIVSLPFMYAENINTNINVILNVIIMIMMTINIIIRPTIELNFRHTL